MNGTYAKEKEEDMNNAYHALEFETYQFELFPRTTAQLQYIVYWATLSGICKIFCDVILS